METMGWLIIFIVLIVIELLTMGLTTIWFAGGALAALLMSVLGFGMAGTGCGIYHRIGSAAGTDETDCGEVF